MKKMKRILCIMFVAIMLMSTFVGCGENKYDITIGSKNYTEAFVLGHMFATIIEENTDVKVERKINLGGTTVALEALKKGEIDLFPEYTGTAYGSIMGKNETNNPDEVYEEVKKYYNDEFDVKWLETLGYNNTYAMAVRKDTAEKYNLKTCSDLAKVSDKLILGSTFEFADRDDGYIGMQKIYNMHFKDTKCVDGTLRYQALVNKKSDVIDAFTTEGLLKAYEIVILEDDKNFFPPYYVAPIVRNDTLKKYPEVQEQLNKLGGLIDEETMIALNFRVDNDGEDPRKVAEDFLKEKGLIN